MRICGDVITSKGDASARNAYGRKSGFEKKRTDGCGWKKPIDMSEAWYVGRRFFKFTIFSCICIFSAKNAGDIFVFNDILMHVHF